MRPFHSPAAMFLSLGHVAAQACCIAIPGQTCGVIDNIDHTLKEIHLPAGWPLSSVFTQHRQTPPILVVVDLTLGVAFGQHVLGATRF